MRGCILVVDDEPAVNLLMRQMFRKEIRAGEYRFVFAEDGLEALDLLNAAQDIDVILSDINMPGMDGLELLQAVRAQFPHIKVIMVSAYNDAPKQRAARDHGAYGFINKPVQPPNMRNVLKEALEAARACRRSA